jgi:hypothetical protein
MMSSSSRLDRELSLIWEVPVNNVHGSDSWACLLMPVWMLGPYVSFAFFAFYLLRSESMPRWLMAILTVCIAYALRCFWPPQLPPQSSSIYGLIIAWWISVIGSVVLFPLVLVREGLKRGWFRRYDYTRPKRAKKGKKQKDP